jgi:hypothetical protein
MRWWNLGLVGLALVLRCEPTPPADTPGVIPAEPEAGTTSSQTVSTFAIQTIFLGDVPTAGGPPSNSAWKEFGYDVDGLITTETSANVCALAPGAPKINQIDGDDGIDNAWGLVLVPILQNYTSIASPSQVETSVVGLGAWTLQIQLTGLSADPKQTALGLRAQVFVSGELGAVPTFDQTTNWPVLPSSLADGATIAGGALVQFSNVYVTNGTLVAEGASQPLLIPLAFMLTPCGECCSVEACDAATPPPVMATLPLLVHDATLTFVHSSSAAAAQGTIAGVLDMQEIMRAAKTLTGDIDPLAACGPPFTGIAQQMMQAQDILQNGTNASGVPCDGISIGLGFTAALVANPTQVGVDPPPQPDPCDAGRD